MRAGRRVLQVFAVMMLVLLACGSFTLAHAAKKGWVMQKNRCYYYAGGRPVTGSRRIGGREYLFDAKGVQKTSWRKVGNAYYCYRSAEKAGGYLLKNTVRNGIRLGRDGRAELSSDRARQKAALMVRVSAFMDRIVEKSKARLSSRRDKLKACYDYLRKKYPYHFVSHFREKDPNHDLWFVNALLTRGYADCHPFAFTFGYLANALGYQDVTVLSWHTKKYGNGGHSWVKMGTKIYDVSLGRYKKKSYSLFGIDEKKYYKKYPYYKIKARRSLSDL